MNLKQLTDKIKVLRVIEYDKLDKSKYKKLIIDVDISEEGQYLIYEWHMIKSAFTPQKKRRPLKMLDYLIKYEGNEKN